MNRDKVVRGLDGNYNRREEMYQDTMRLRDSRHGFFRVPDGPKGNILCSICGIELNGSHTLINGKALCSQCLGKEVRKS